MTPSAITSFFSTDRTFEKWIVDSTRTHTTIEGGVVPVDYYANGNIRGILVEDASENLFPDSTSFSHSDISFTGGAEVSSSSVGGSSSSVFIDNSDEDEYMTCSFSDIEAEYISISFFVSGKSSVYGMRILLNGRKMNVRGSDLEEDGPFSDGSYRFRVRAFVPGGVVSSISIGKEFTQSGDFNFSNVQVEKDKWTSYIPTTNGPESREKEKVYRNLTHGLDYNKDQGTMDLIYSPTPGSVGAAMTFRDSEWDEWVSVGVQTGETGSPENARFSSSSSSIGSMTSYSHESLITSYHSFVRFCFSGYGVRVINVNDTTGRIGYLKDFDSFLNGIPDRVVFGECYDETHFTGHINLLNIYARTFNDDEMRGDIQDPDIPEPEEDGVILVSAWR